MGADYASLEDRIDALLTKDINKIKVYTDGYDGQAQDARPFNLSEPNLLSVPGAVLAWTFAMLVGDAAHVFYVLTFVWSMMLLTHRPVDRSNRRKRPLARQRGPRQHLLPSRLRAGALSRLDGGGGRHERLTALKAPRQ